MRSKSVNRLIDLLLLLFALLSIFYLVKTLLFSPNGYERVKEYRQSIAYLDQLIEKEKKENLALREKLNRLHQNRTLYLKTFSRDYLFMVPPDEWIILKRKTP